MDEWQHRTVCTALFLPAALALLGGVWIRTDRLDVDSALKSKFGQTQRDC
jgi:hypothetical protein